MSEYISKLESYTDLEVSIIRKTKINKVLKNIIKLSSIPKEEEFNFKKRSHELLAEWNKILVEDTGAEGAGEKDESATINGVAKEDKHDGDENEKSEARATTEEEEKATEVHHIGTGVEGAKEAEPPAEPETAAPADAKTDEPDVAHSPEKRYDAPAETLEATA